MKGPVKVIGKAVVERATGLVPGRPRALIAATFTGTATAVVTYRLLHGGSLVPGR